MQVWVHVFVIDRPPTETRRRHLRSKWVGVVVRLNDWEMWPRPSYIKDGSSDHLCTAYYIYFYIFLLWFDFSDIASYMKGHENQTQTESGVWSSNLWWVWEPKREPLKLIHFQLPARAEARQGVRIRKWMVLNSHCAVHWSSLGGWWGHYSCSVQLSMPLDGR